MESLESKETLRLRMKALRESLKRREVMALSHAAGSRLLESSLLDRLTAVAMYAAVGNEVATRWLFRHLRARACRVFFPRVVRGRIEFVQTDDWKALVPGRWGIPTPVSGEPEALDDIEGIVVPGVAFDEGGGRLGFGKGYYDRALGSYGGLKVGLAYDFQVLPAIFRTEEDLVCDWVVTEKRLIRGAHREEATWNLKRS